MSRSLAMSGKAMATKSLKEKWLSMVQLAREKRENGTGGSSTVTHITAVFQWDKESYIRQHPSIKSVVGFYGMLVGILHLR